MADFDWPCEGRVLATILLKPEALAEARDAGLTDRCFSVGLHQRVWRAIVGVSERGERPDSVAVARELHRRAEGDPDQDVANVLAPPDSVGGYKTIEADVGWLGELAVWRLRAAAAQRILVAAESRREEDFARAERELAESAPRVGTTLSPEEWAHVMFESIQPLPEGKREDLIPMPFQALTTALDGGLAPGELMAVAGYTSHGKSILLDQMLDAAAKEGRRVHAYLTEMTPTTRGLRYLARNAGVNYKALRRRDVPPDRADDVMDAIASVPYGVTIAADLTPDAICADVRSCGWDLAVIDLIHGLDWSDEESLRRISGTLKRTAIATGSRIVYAAHLNESQSGKSPKRPRPGMQSLKGTSALKQDADVVCFVWLKDDENGVPTEDGEVFIAKARNASLGGTSVTLDPARVRFSAKEGL